jgi:hypothetical protein
MPAIDFPASPSVNDEYSFEGRTWLWNGTGWEVKSYPAALQLGSASAPSLYFTGDPNTGLYSPGADQVAISTNGLQRVTIEQNGRLFVGTAAAITIPLSSSTLGNCRYQQQGVAQADASAFYSAYSTTASVAPNIVLGRSRGALGQQAIVNSGDALGRIIFLGSDGQVVATDAGFIRAAVIEAAVDGVPSVSSMPSRLVFSTTAGGAASPTERMRIDSSGRIGFNNTNLGGASGNYRFGGIISGAASSSGILYTPTIQPDATTTASLFQTQPSTASNGAVPYAITNLFHYQTVQGTFNVDSTVTNQYGFGVNSSLTGATNNFGFYSNLSSAAGRWNFYAASTADSYFASNNFIFANGGTERARIDSSGRLLVGTSTAVSDASTVSRSLQVLGVNASTAGQFIARFDNGVNAPGLVFGKSRGATVGTYTIVASGDQIGRIAFDGADGAKFVSAALIAAEVDGTPGTDDMPGRLVFSTTADGTGSPTEAFRITNDRVHCYNQAAPAAVDTTATLTVADLKTGIITSSTAAAVTMTLPTGTDTEAGFSGIYTNMTFEWSVINTGATNAVTVQGGTGHTLVGSGTVAASNSGRFASRRTASNTFVTYRLSS